MGPSGYPVDQRRRAVDGLAASASGVLGSCGVSTLSSCVGVILATGVAARVIANAIGAIMFALAFLPRFTAVLFAIPTPVVAGALLFIGCFILVGGMQIITSRMLDARKALVIGLSVTAALAVLMFPSLAASAPAGLKPLFGSALVTGLVVAFALNLVFRLGVRQDMALQVDLASDYPQAIEDFFTYRGKTWGARPDVVRRAIFGVTQLTEAVIEGCNPRGPLVIGARFDEYNLDVHVSYRGDLLEFPDMRPSEREVREDEDGTRRLAGFMLVHFHFDHWRITPRQSGKDVEACAAVGGCGAPLGAHAATGLPGQPEFHAAEKSDILPLDNSRLNDYC
jgi:xanthine permease XanP